MGNRQRLLAPGGSSGDGHSGDAVLAGLERSSRWNLSPRSERALRLGGRRLRCLLLPSALPWRGVSAPDRLVMY